MKLNLGVLLAAALLLPVTSHATTTSPGKSSVFTTETGVLSVTGDITPITGQILKAKKKTVLRIEVMLSVGPDAAIPGLYAQPFVGGNAQPSSAFSQCVSGNSQNCTMTATFWVDMDGPGVVPGQPVNISVNAGNATAAAAGVPYIATLSATVVRK